MHASSADAFADFPDALRERCWGLLDQLREGTTYSLTHLLWLHDVTLEQVRAREASWRVRARYQGPSLLTLAAEPRAD